LEAGKQVAGNSGGSADGSGAERERRGNFLADGCSHASALGPASIGARDEDVIQLEIWAAQGVGAVANAWANLLPASSPWRDLYADLATSLADDESRLSLVGSGESDARP
jgi:hypothetical protein